MILCSWCVVDEKGRDGDARYNCFVHAAADATEGHLNGGGILALPRFRAGVEGRRNGWPLKFDGGGRKNRSSGRESSARDIAYISYDKSRAIPHMPWAPASTIERKCSGTSSMTDLDSF